MTKDAQGGHVRNAFCRDGCEKAYAGWLDVMCKLIEELLRDPLLTGSMIQKLLLLSLEDGKGQNRQVSIILLVCLTVRRLGNRQFSGPTCPVDVCTTLPWVGERDGGGHAWHCVA